MTKDSNERPVSEARRPAEPLTRRRLIANGGALASMLVASRTGHASEEQTSPVLTLRNRVDDLGPPGVDAYHRRIDRARSLLKDLGLGALVIESSPSLRYFSGLRWRPSERVLAFVIPLRGEPFYICPAFEEGRARDRLVVETELRVWQEDESPFERLVQGLVDRKLGSTPIGLDPAARYFVHQGLVKALAGGSIVDGSSVVQGCRGRKDAEEIRLMRRANEITQAAIHHAASRVTEGLRQDELAAAVREAHRSQGAPGGWALVLFGANAAYPHGRDGEVRLQEGNVVLMDCGTDVHGYQSDMTRTFVFGRPPTDRQNRIFETVRRAQAAAFAAARPGITCGEVDRAARKVIEEAGFGHGYERFTHRLGHGIGLEGHEWPYLRPGNGIRLAEGMTTSNEPGIYIPGEIGVRLEDILHVTEAGCEALTPLAEPLAVIGL